MRIEHIGKNTVKVTITRAELAGCGIVPDSLSPDDPFTLMLVSNLADKVLPGAEKSRITVEILRIRSGSVIYLTPEAEKDRPMRRTILTVSSADELMKLCRALKRRGARSTGSLLTGGDDHLRLIADIPDTDLPSALTFPADEQALAKIYEHDKVIIPENAIDTLLSAKLSGLSEH